MLYDLSLLLIIPAILITLYAQIKVSSTFKKASKIRNANSITGVETAKKILMAEGLGDIPVEQSKGKLSDHYHPIKRSISLSTDVYGKPSIAALGVAAHEVGHALQHRDSYSMLTLRTAIYPVVGFSSWLAPILIIAGFFIAEIPQILLAGIIMYAVTVLFTVITLPVEFDASKRAMVAINKLGLVTADESKQVKKVLNAAALTYVAAAITAVLELIRFILIFSARD